VKKRRLTLTAHDVEESRHGRRSAHFGWKRQKLTRLDVPLLESDFDTRALSAKR